jgi:hypothetical protein
MTCRCRSPQQQLHLLGLVFEGHKAAEIVDVDALQLGMDYIAEILLKFPSGLTSVA